MTVTTKKKTVARKTVKAKPKADKDGWIPFSGGECPVGRATHVDVRFRGGGENYDGNAGLYWTWKHIGSSGDIVAYRPPRATEDFDDLNGRAARIIDLHKDKHPRHFTIADTRETI